MTAADEILELVEVLNGEASGGRNGDAYEWLLGMPEEDAKRIVTDSTFAIAMAYGMTPKALFAIFQRGVIVGIAAERIRRGGA